MTETKLCKLELDRPDLGTYLLELRRSLEGARSREEQAKALRAFAELVPPDISGR